ncbi:enoyl-CoA hydratase-related protein [Pelagibaculum spongiae]|uniref:Hydrogenase maturation protein n=1 Tax=Pelagibaculum spongiae TaxID=2080658 RepID=A0A2V1GU02_9GAMM|nr:enoyl-CoA hydratase-related protein [Pelagibaculum spongiae]PVZ68800.1 hydrogenase maturation protein [Pelagibaculum spongiae]
MRILLLCHAFNSLTQRLFVELKARDHQLSICIDVNDQNTQAAIDQFKPDLILAPFLKRAMGESIWKNNVCLIVHPGPIGERGPSSLDRALLSLAENPNSSRNWGVTVLQAVAEMDAGPVWGHSELTLTHHDKSACYRNEITEAALSATLQSIDNIQAAQQPLTIDHSSAEYLGFRPLLLQKQRAIDWQKDPSQLILGKIRSAHSFPGLLDQIDGINCYICDAWPEGKLNQDLQHAAGNIIARREYALCRATIDGAIWIGHGRLANSAIASKGDSKPSDCGLNPIDYKLPLFDLLQPLLPHLAEIPQSPLAIDVSVDYLTFRDIKLDYLKQEQEQEQLAVLHFSPHNGAFSTEFCRRLLAAWQQAAGNDNCKAIILAGSSDFWSNGINLNTIEAAESPADESWANIQAMDDLCQAIIQTTDKLVVAAMQGNAGAGGVFMALAADQIYARNGIIFNPHYRGMGNLFGSEYWTYLLPKRCSNSKESQRAGDFGQSLAEKITKNCLPLSTEQALQWQLVDQILDRENFLEQVIEKTQSQIADTDQLAVTLQQKQQTRQQDEAEKPLQAYRDQELAHMQQNFYGFDLSYHVARFNFVSKRPKSRTPSWLQFIG